MASLQMMKSKNWTNISEWKVMFLLSKHHQTWWDIRHKVGHGLDTRTMKKDRMDRLNHDGLSTKFPKTNKSNLRLPLVKERGRENAWLMQAV